VLAFDLMQGDVFKYMVKRGTTAAECALTENQAKALFHQVLSGIEYIHKNLIIHSDLKLENLL
jgi:serine/threonine protein kinase